MTAIDTNYQSFNVPSRDYCCFRCITLSNHTFMNSKQGYVYDVDAACLTCCGSGLVPIPIEEVRGA